MLWKWCPAYVNCTATLPATRRTTRTLRRGPPMDCNSNSSGNPSTLGTRSKAPDLEKSLTMHRSCLPLVSRISAPMLPGRRSARRLFCVRGVSRFISTTVPVSVGREPSNLFREKTVMHATDASAHRRRRLRSHSEFLRLINNYCCCELPPICLQLVRKVWLRVSNFLYRIAGPTTGWIETASDPSAEVTPKDRPAQDL